MTQSAARDRILMAARAEFATRGFQGARVARIAAAAGLNKQLIYHYFGSKAGLHAAADAAPPVAIREPGTSGPEALREAVNSLVTQLEQRPDIAVTLTDPNAQTAPAAGAVGWFDAARLSLAQLISSGQGLGFYRDDVEPELLARQALLLCVGFAAVRDPRPVDPVTWRHAVADTLVRATSW